MGLGLLKEWLELVLGGGLFLLHELDMTLGDAPAVWGGQGRAQGSS